RSQTFRDVRGERGRRAGYRRQCVGMDRYLPRTSVSGRGRQVSAAAQRELRRACRGGVASQLDYGFHTRPEGRRMFGGYTACQPGDTPGTGLTLLGGSDRRPAGRRSACGLAAFGQADQIVHLQHNDALAPSVDQASLFPSTQQTADGMQRGARHFRDFLSGDGEVDGDAFLGFLARGVHQTQDTARDTLLDFFGGEFLDACVGVLQSLTYRLYGVEGELGV